MKDAKKRKKDRKRREAMRRLDLFTHRDKSSTTVSSSTLVQSVFPESRKEEVIICE
jgi:hypothetical protein